MDIGPKDAEPVDTDPVDIDSKLAKPASSLRSSLNRYPLLYLLISPY